MAYSSDILFLVSQLVDGILAAHDWVASRSMASTGLPMPLSIFVALPFGLPAAWALATRHLLLLLCVGGLAWLASTALLGAQFGPAGLLQFSTALLAAVYLCAKARLDARQKVRLRAELDEAQSALALTASSLDRERFWRRANGDLRSMVGDSEIAILMDRIQSFGRKRTEENGMPGGA